MVRNKKALSEDQSRDNLLATARKLGCEQEVKQIFNKYDALLKSCTNKSERDQMAILGIVELHKLLGCRAPLVVNEQEVLPGDPTSTKA
jgi:hypothetical protein